MSENNKKLVEETVIYNEAESDNLIEETLEKSSEVTIWKSTEKKLEKEPKVATEKTAEAPTGKSKKKPNNYVKILVFSAVAIALALVTSMIKVIDLPMGGAVTLFSMLFISLVGYWFGPVKGIIAAIVYGILQFAINPYFVTFPQVLCDYVFAFGSLGLSGFFNKMKYGLQIGYLVSIFGRFVFSFLSGLLFFAAYAEGSGYGAVLYSFLYNGAYIGLEGAITLVILFIPPVAKAMKYVKRMALS